jgi:hypothetical protein
MKMSVSDKRMIAVVSACMRGDGSPTFVRMDVAVTSEEAENGVHYYLVEADLLELGYEEPFVHFAEGEMPAFLLSAVEPISGVDTETIDLSLSEEP